LTAPAFKLRPESTPLPDDLPLTLAWAYRDAEGKDGRVYTLHHWMGDFYRYDGAAYRKLIPEQLRSELYRFLDEQTVVTKDGGAERFRPRTRRVNEVLDALSAISQAHSARMPCWLDEHRGIDARNVIAFRNGILNVAEWLDGQLVIPHPPTPYWFSENVLPYDYRPGVGCPVWLAFLAEALSGDASCISLLQEWFGYCLCPDTSQQKMLWMHGPGGAGKGTVIRTMKRIVGAPNCASPGLGSLAERFGLGGLMGKTVAFCADAHLGRSADSVQVLDRLLAIVGEDDVDVERKNRDVVSSVRLTVRFTLAVNQLPTLPDPSNALRRRTLMLPFLQSFEGREDTSLDAKLERETPGIANWALDGLRRLRLQGKFTLPTASEDLLARFCQLSSPIKTFVEETCTIDPEETVNVNTLYAAYRKWTVESGHSPASKNQFGEQLRTAVPAVSKRRVRDGGDRVMEYYGINLRMDVAAATPP
jgi:putative DNA primase/helicase